MRKTFRLELKSRSLELGHRTLIMGIVNVTPDSFSDGGRFLDRDKALEQARQLVAEGADFIDIGGESTRPFSDPVDAEQETRRVLPVIEALRRRMLTPISIDTTKAVVARRALAAGADIINDVSAMRNDREMVDVAAAFEAPVILMHMRGKPKNMQVEPVYADLMAEVEAFLEQRIDFAVSAGIPRERIVIDPGVGFGKTCDHNLTLINNLSLLARLEVPILVGPSRKAFIRSILKSEDGRDPDPGSPEVETGTQAAVAVSVLNGAHIVRVHSVAQTRATVKVIDAFGNLAHPVT
jgi:dihydropteroate synthase